MAGRLRDALREPRVRANALLFFLYTGAEASAGQWAFSLLTESRGMAPAAAGARRVRLLGQHLRRTPRLRPRGAPRGARRPPAARHGRRAARRSRGVPDAERRGRLRGPLRPRPPARSDLPAPDRRDAARASASGTPPTPSASRSRRRPSAPARCPRSPASSPATPGSSPSARSCWGRPCSSSCSLGAVPAGGDPCPPPAPPAELSRVTTGAGGGRSGHCSGSGLATRPRASMGLSGREAPPWSGAPSTEAAASGPQLVPDRPLLQAVRLDGGVQDHLHVRDGGGHPQAAASGWSKTITTSLGTPGRRSSRPVEPR